MRGGRTTSCGGFVDDPEFFTPTSARSEEFLLSDWNLLADLADLVEAGDISDSEAAAYLAADRERRRHYPASSVVELRSRRVGG